MAYFASRWYFKNCIERFVQPGCGRIDAILSQPVYSGVEGALILLAAASIAWTAVPRLIAPRPLEQVGIGLAVSVVAALLNFVVARLLLDAGNKYRSITLEADAQHLLTNVWTSAGIVIGVGVVVLTGWTRLDPNAISARRCRVPPFLLTWSPSGTPPHGRIFLSIASMTFPAANAI
jgi:hypothetical protein